MRFFFLLGMGESSSGGSQNTLLSVRISKPGEPIFPTNFLVNNTMMQ